MKSRSVRKLMKNQPVIVAAILICSLIAIALFAPFIIPCDVATGDLSFALEPPTWEHPLGRDTIGRDILSRLILGSRISLQVGFVVVTISVLIGVGIGASAGYFGGLYDEVIMRAIDILLAFPGILLAIAMIAVLGPNLRNVMIALCAMGWVGYARLVRGQVLIVRELAYVEAAKALGASHLRIIVVHIIPNVLAAVIVQATLGMAGAITAEAGLSFLGLGVQPPIPSWGSMLHEGSDCLRTAPHVMLFPGLAIMITVLCLNIIGDGLRDALDPKMESIRK